MTKYWRRILSANLLPTVFQVFIRMRFNQLQGLATMCQITSKLKLIPLRYQANRRMLPKYHCLRDTKSRQLMIIKFKEICICDCNRFNAVIHSTNSRQLSIDIVIGQKICEFYKMGIRRGKDSPNKAKNIVRLPLLLRLPPPLHSLGAHKNNYSSSFEFGCTKRMSICIRIRALV